MGIEVAPAGRKRVRVGLRPGLRSGKVPAAGERKQGAADAASTGKPAKEGAKPKKGGGRGSRKKGGVIRFGLGAIKGVGRKAVEAIGVERENGGKFSDIFDFCERVDLSQVNRGTVEALICAGAFDRTGAMRRALCDVLDDAISHGQGLQRDKKSGQMGLFGAPGDGPAAPDLPPPSLGSAEWSEAEMLKKEKGVLGFYITKHPLASHEELLRACGTARIGDLSDFPDGADVVVGGMVSSLRTLIARSGRNAGKKLGVITLEDLTGRIEALVFSTDLPKYQPLLTPDEVVFIVGQVDRKREEPSLRVSSVVAAADAAESLSEALLINVNSMTPVDELIERLRGGGRISPTTVAPQGAGGTNGNGSSPRVVGGNGTTGGHAAGTAVAEAPAGTATSAPAASEAPAPTTPVYLNVPTTDGMLATVRCGPGYNVICSRELLNDLCGMLGPEAVCVLSRSRRAIPLPRKAEPV
jgi:hypothetical protein